MIEVEPTVENVQPGDTVTIEEGAPGEPGHRALTYRVNENECRTYGEFRMTTLERYLFDAGFRITRITRPSLPIPTKVGERFWARWDSREVEEYLVIDGRQLVHLFSGTSWTRDDFPHTVVPAPEPKAVPVPARLIQEAEEWWTELSDAPMRSSWAILKDIVQAVQGQEAGDE